MQDSTRFPRKKQKDYERSKHRVLHHADALARRDGGFHCHYCKIKLIPPNAEDFYSDLYFQPDPKSPGMLIPRDGYYWCSVDHVVPWTQGGSDGLENLVLACVRCNSSKKDKTGEALQQWKDKHGYK